MRSSYSCCFYSEIYILAFVIMKTALELEKQNAIRIAKQLHYDKEIIQKIKQAETSYEIGRLLKQARLDWD